MKRIALILLATLALVPAAAVADGLELGMAFTYQGEIDGIARPPGFYNPGDKARVELEATALGKSVHLHMTPGEAREAAAILEALADDAEGL